VSINYTYSFSTKGSALACVCVCVCVCIKNVGRVSRPRFCVLAFTIYITHHIPHITTSHCVCVCLGSGVMHSEQTFAVTACVVRILAAATAARDDPQNPREPKKCAHPNPHTSSALVGDLCFPRFVAVGALHMGSTVGQDNW
jgi:hypothetical protein